MCTHWACESEKTARCAAPAKTQRRKNTGCWQENFGNFESRSAHQNFPVADSSFAN